MIVTGIMMNSFSLNECSKLTMPMQSPQYTTRVQFHVDIPSSSSIEYKRVGFLLSPAIIPRFVDGLNDIDPNYVMATVSKISTRVLSPQETWTCAVYSADEIKNSSAAALASFFPNGYSFSLEGVIESSALEAKTKLVSYQSSPLLEIKGNIPLLSIMGLNVLYTTNPVLRQSIANRTFSESDLVVEESQYIVAGVLVLEGFTQRKRVVFDIEIGCDLTWYKKQDSGTDTENVDIVNESNTVSPSSTNNTAVIVNTIATQSNTMNHLYQLNKDGDEMYGVVSQSTTVKVTNTSDEQLTVNYYTTEPNIGSKVDGNKVFPNGTVPDSSVFFPNESWLQDSVYSQSREEKRREENPFPFQQIVLNPGESFFVILGQLTTLMTMLGIGNKVNVAGFMEGISSNFIQSTPSNNALETDSTQAWNILLGLSLILSTSNGSLSGLSIVTEFTNAIKAIKGIYEVMGIPYPGETLVFSQERDIEMLQFDELYFLPSLLFNTDKLPSYDQETTWHIEAMDLSISYVTTNPTTDYTLNVAKCTQEVLSNEGSLSRNPIYPGLWKSNIDTGYWNYNESFYKKNGFVFDNKGFFESVHLNSSNLSTLISLLPESEKLFLIQKAETGNEFSIPSTAKDAIFTLPKQKEGILKQICPLLVRLQRTRPTSSPQKITFKIKISVAATRID